MPYQIFIRDWWIDNPKFPNGLEPGPGPKEFVKIVDTFQQARDYCQEYNSTHEPGRLSRKAEFEGYGG